MFEFSLSVTRDSADTSVYIHVVFSIVEAASSSCVPRRSYRFRFRAVRAETGERGLTGVDPRLRAPQTRRARDTAHSSLALETGENCEKGLTAGAPGILDVFHPE